MDASIVAVGLIVLHAFATAVLWFELRSHEKESRERVEKATRAVLDAINLLRGDLAPILPGGGGAPPSGPSGGGALASSAPDPAEELAPASGSRRSLPPSRDERAAIRARYEAHADAQDVRDAERAAQLPPDDASIAARMEAAMKSVRQDAPFAPDNDHEAAEDAPIVFDDDAGDDRSTDEEFTHVMLRQRKAPPHKPPVPVKRGTLEGIQPERPRSDHRRTVADFQARRDGDRVTPTQPSPAPALYEDGHCHGRECFQDDGNPIQACMCECGACGASIEALLREQEREARGTPSVPPPLPRFDARVARRWHELIEEAHADGKAARHCGGEKCVGSAGGIAECSCLCPGGCGLLADLLAQAKREAGAR